MKNAAYCLTRIKIYYLQNGKVVRKAIAASNDYGTIAEMVRIATELGEPGERYELTIFTSHLWSKEREN